MSISFNKPAINAIKLVILLFLSWFIISKVNLGEIYSIISTAKVNYLTLTLAVIFINYSINTYLWNYLLQIQAVHIPYLRLAAIFFIGLFYSNFIPSGMGNNIVGAYKVTQYSKEGIGSTVAIFFSKFLTLISLLVMAFVSLILLEENILGAYLKHFSILVVGALLCCFLLFNEKVMMLLLSWRPIKERKGLLGLLERVHDSFGLVRLNKGKVAVAFGIATIFQITGILGDYCAALSLGININLGVFFLILPVIRLIALIPITFNGLGVREGSFIIFFSKYGLSPSQSFSIPLISLFINLILSILLGGGALLLERNWEKNHLAEPL